MKTAWFDFFAGRRDTAFRIITGLTAVFLLGGCTMIRTQVPEMVPDYQPKNVYRQSPLLPANVKRVAVLPLTTLTSTALLQSGVEGLQTILYAELGKAGRFEVIPVSAEHLREWTGETSWRADEQLPVNLMDLLRENTGCDAVMFCQLIRYQPYEPMAVGWKFNLVEKPAPVAAQKADLASTNKNHELRILWSADEIFDAGNVAVANAARTYYSKYLRNDAPAPDSSTILGSPTRFGQYTLNALFTTLPSRGNP